MMSNTLRFPVEIRDKWGLINEAGEYVVKPIYEDMGWFSEGLVSFRQNNRIGFLNRDGKEVITANFEPYKHRMPEFSGGLAAIKMDSKVGYMDYSGSWRIPPMYDVGFDFMKGHALVAKEVFRVINSSGEVISELPASDISYKERWPDNWSAFTARLWRGQKLFTVALNQYSDIVFPPRFALLTDFCNGVAGFAVSEDDIDIAFGLVALNEQIVRNPEFIWMKGFSEGLAVAGSISNRKFGFINSSGEYLISPQFDRALSFSEGRAGVFIGGKWGFIDNQGKMMVEPQFERVASYRDKYARVKTAAGQAIIDSFGQRIWES